MIDFELYRIFVAVAEEKNITRASEKLNISQPAITKYIKKLENQLDTKLLIRRSKGVDLTSEGEEIYEKLKEPIEEIIKIDDKIRKEKVINIGTHNHMGSCIFGEVINEYCLKYPEVNLNLICEENQEMMKKLKRGELDIVFAKKDLHQKINGVTYIKLGYLHDVIIAGRNSEFATKELTLENIEEQIIYVPRVYAQAVYRIKELTSGKELKLKNSSYNTILKLASTGNALGLITREYVKEDEYEKFKIKEVQTSINLGEIEFGIFYIKPSKSKEVNNLIKVIKRYFL